MNKIKSLLSLSYYFIRFLFVYIPIIIKVKYYTMRGELDKARNVVHKQATSKLLNLLKINLEVEGEMDVAIGARPIIVMSNHPSMLDIPTLLQVLPLQLRMIYSYEVLAFPFPFWAWLIQSLDHLPISTKAVKQLNQDKQNIDDAFAEGGLYWAAPEGGLEGEKGLTNFKKTLFHIAKKNDAIILPVCIIGSNKIIAQAKDWLSVKINTGKTIKCCLLASVDSRDYDDVTALRDKVFTMVKSRLDSE